MQDRKEGTVEVLAQGKEDDLLALLKWCEKGPRLAKVERIEIKWREQEEKIVFF